MAWSDPVVLVQFLAVAAVGVWVGVRLARGWRSWRSRRRTRQGSRGERVALRLLARRGYRVIGTQVPAQSVVLVDGRRETFQVRADAVVAKGRRRFVAECKTGCGASVGNRSTRRQLLEYALNYEVDGVLLVDATRRTIVENEFPALDDASAMCGNLGDTEDCEQCPAPPQFGVP